MIMIAHTIERLEHLCRVIPALLKGIDEPSFSSQPQPGKWSKKEILGHLVDSATNNHQRFVRGQFENTPTIIYDQDKWNESNHYLKINSAQLITFWENYNRHLLEVVKNIPEKKLQNKVNSGGEDNYTLEFLIQDYVVHMEHHLKQVVVY
ncbi:MAG: DinB family protein [Bacteroidota bacterium]